MGKTPSGCTSRTFKTTPTLSFLHLELCSLGTPLADLYKKAWNGVLVTQVLGLHTANPVTGDFSVGATGLIIRNGNLAEPVSGFALSGNVMDLFREISDTGDDQRFFGSVMTPTVLVGSGLKIGGN